MDTFVLTISFNGLAVDVKDLARIACLDGHNEAVLVDGPDLGFAGLRLPALTIVDAVNSAVGRTIMGAVQLASKELAAGR